MFYVPVNSYGHVGTVSSSNHSFYLGKLDYGVNQYFMHILFACNWQQLLLNQRKERVWL